jgi:asparagine synthase (glutamine-hydrolysing)
MANSVETRVPYLDHRLIEIMYTLPSQYKMRNGQTKYLARKILQKHFGVTLNTDVKHYVATPQREWLKSNLNDEVTDILKNGYLMKNGFIKMETFLADYKQYKQSRELGNSFFVWKMLNLEFLLSSYF